MFIKKFKVSIKKLSVLSLLFVSTSGVAYAQAMTLWDIQNMVFQVVDFLIIVGGVIAVGFIIWSGIRWMSAGADTSKAQSAKESLKNGIIGAIIILGVGVIMATIENILITGRI